MKLSVGLAACVLLVTMPAAAQDSRQQRDRCTDGEPDVAIRACTAIIDSGQQTTADLAVTFFNRGWAFSMKGQYDRAIQDYDQAIRLVPNNTDAFNNRGNAFSTKGQFDRAIQDFDQAIRLDPNSVIAFSSRCLARASTGALAAALADCNVALRLSPNRRSTLGNRAFTYLKMKRLPEAIADCNAVLRLNSKDAFALFARGIARRLSGERPGGDADIAAANAIDPGIAAYFAQRGVTP